MTTELTRQSQQPPRQSKKPTWKLKLTLVGISLFAAVALCEIGIRLALPVTDVPFMFWDPLIGTRRIPNQSGRYYFGREIAGQYRFNAQGWNNIHDYSGAKPRGTRRVCLVGDSFVEAMNVPLDQTMASQAERIMSRPERPVEWYSFGNSGFGTSHEYLVIHHYALDFKPDAVVMLFVCNDPIDSSPYLATQEPWMATMSLDDDGDLLYTPPAQYIPSWRNRLMARSALVRYVMIQKGLFARRSAVPIGQMSVRQAMGVGTHESETLQLSREQRVEKTWALIGALLDRSRRECEAHGAHFLLVFQGHRWEIEAAAAGDTYSSPPLEVDPYCQNERINDMGRQYLEPLARRLGISYLDLTEPLIAAVRTARRRHNYVDDAHFNEIGHRAAAEAMSAAVEKLWAQPVRVRETQGDKP